MTTHQGELAFLWLAAAWASAKRRRWRAALEALVNAHRRRVPTHWRSGRRLVDGDRGRR